MRQSLTEYFHAVVRKWVMLVFAIGNLLGIVSLVIGYTILLPYWAWFVLGVIALIVAQFLAYHEVRKRVEEGGNEVGSAVLGLESEDTTVGEQSISMAGLFWGIGRHFVEGVNSSQIFPLVARVFERQTGEESKQAAKVAEKLTYKLRLLQIIRDEQRQQGHTGYMVTVTTSLGDSVLKELAKKWGDSPWPASIKERLSDGVDS